jgi:hypothetical protein
MKINLFVRPNSMIWWSEAKTLQDHEHVSETLNNCAQILYALRIIKAHGMSKIAIQTVFQAVVNAKITYATPAWWGFTSAAERQRINAFIRRCVRSNLCSPDVKLFEEQCAVADERLFSKIISNQDHLLYPLLPQLSTGSQNYNLRYRTHNFELPAKTTRSNDRNFINRMLFNNRY